MTWWQQLDIDRSKKEPLYQQLYRQIKEGIAAEELEKNSRLLPIRELAEKFEVNPATVVKAYELLEEEGLIYKRVGSGSFVAPEAGGPGNAISEREQDSLEMLGYGQLDLSGDINFASATPAPSLFPVADFKIALNHVLERDQGEAFTYQKSQGFYPLRRSIQSYFSRQGLEIPVEEIQIVSGAQQAIDLTVKIFLDYGRQVLVERPTYPGAISAFKSRAATIDSIPLKEDGPDLQELENKLSRNRYQLFYTMTSFHNPTGICWSKEKKQRLIQLAEEYNFLIIEDDCLSELCYQGEPPLPLKSFDQQGRVLYIKSFSKIFMPGLRLAFLTLPEKYQSRLLAAKHATDISSAGLTQRAMDYYLREGLWQKHIDRIGHLFQQRFTTMLAEIKDKLLPPLTIPFVPRGGIYFWLRLPAEGSGRDFYLAARQQNVALLPGEVFIHPRDSQTNIPYFRLSFAAVSEEEIKTGITRLKKACQDLNQQDSPSDEGYLPLV